MVKVLFFARLRQQLGTGELSLGDFSGSLGDLRQALCAQYPDWSVHLQRDDIRMALNQELAEPEAVVNAGDEVAFFPPVTGG
ncbi:molybdopterin converting factor subunit 1 [Microbulbifer sp. OS29]|uniref:Molybdopterin synthase sulfur carrier subunit n=1 Tax=Microbulbifer okhotskensis TaxID=2926617 RepID=A0A9X2ELR3_9GAMM|nr:molybdopterin converting factor subunit 1 [Microbulbifer okhotskensis]MCO1334564.1 molybdopterin converting factor subunit 1 [Microbulbifer okhotskensis]